MSGIPVDAHLNYLREKKRIPVKVFSSYFIKLKSAFFLNTSLFTSSAPQIEQSGSANFTSSGNFDLGYSW
jgi:hypothetical protein